MKETEENKKTEDKKLQRFLRYRAWILNTVCLALALWGIVALSKLFIRYNRYEITNDAMVDQYIVPLSVRASGYVEKLGFQEYQMVYAGDTLLTLEASEYRIRLQESMAALTEAQGNLDVLEYTVRAAWQNIQTQDAEIEEKKERLSQLEKDKARYESLLRNDAVSRQQYEQLTSECKATEAMVRALESKREWACTQYEESRSKKKTLEAVVERRQADVDMARLNLSYTVLTAPYTGVIGKRTLEKGQMVQAGQVVTYLVRSRDKWVTANFKETQIANIHVGQVVRIKVDAYKDRTFMGRVTAISEATGSKFSLVPTDNATGNFVKIQQRIPVRIDLEEISDQDMELLRAGMMVVVEAVKGH